MSRKAVASGILDIDGTIQIPIKIYLGIDIYGIRGTTYHENCGARIRQENKCEKHPNLAFPAHFSGVDYSGTIVPVDRQVRDDLLGRKITKFTVVKAYKTSQLADLIAKRKFVMAGLWSANPVAVQELVDSAYEEVFSTLLYRMIVKKVFLLARMPLAGMERYCLLWAVTEGKALGLHIMPLAYQEEIRPIEMFESTNKSGLIDSAIQTLINAPEPTLSLVPIKTRVDRWFKSMVKPPKIGIIKELRVPSRSKK